jgi:Regulatory subunit of type II PKA R-subunit
MAITIPYGICLFSLSRSRVLLLLTTGNVVGWQKKTATVLVRMEGAAAVGPPPSVNKYAQDFKVPEELPEILRRLTREILRSQPADINKFASEHFANELRIRQAGEEE